MIVTAAVLVLALGAGYALVGVLVPEPAPTRRARAAAAVVDLLGAAAVAVLALHVVELLDQRDLVPDADLVAFHAGQGAWQAGMLVALAAIVHLAVARTGAGDDRPD